MNAVNLTAHIPNARNISFNDDSVDYAIQQYPDISGLKTLIISVGIFILHQLIYQIAIKQIKSWQKPQINVFPLF